MTSQTFRTWITSALVTGAVAVAAVALTTQDPAASPSSAGIAADALVGEASSGTTVTNALDTSTAPTTEPSTVGLDAIDTDARFSVSVLDVDTGQSLTYGTGAFDTASVVKVDILAALLHQHERAGTELSEAEQALATAMIERSDNDAATTLFEAVGGEAGLEAFDDEIGLTDTDVGSNGSWGLTQTTSADQVSLLQVVLGDDSVLSPASQAYARTLMSNVVDSQRFGVSAAADDPDDAALKVGYLQRSTTGRWDVTSTGEIESGGHTYVLTVLSDGNVSFDAGVTLVDEVARTAVSAMG